MLILLFRLRIQDLTSKKPHENTLNPTRFVNQVDLIRSLEEAADFKMDNNTFKGKKMSKWQMSEYVNLFSPEYDDRLTEKPKNRPIHRFQPPSAPQPMTVETEEFIETTSNSENWVSIFTNFL